MKKLRIYLDTSVINFLFADDAPEKRDATIEFFDDYVSRNRYSTFVSPVVTDEIARTKDADKKNMLLAAVREHGLAFLDVEPEQEIAELATAYVAEGIIPEQKYDDALHVAVCTFHEVDVLVSWNFHHLANVNKERRIAVVNQSLGYFYPLRLTTPLEVMDES